MDNSPLYQYPTSAAPSSSSSFEPIGRSRGWNDLRTHCSSFDASLLRPARVTQGIEPHFVYSRCTGHKKALCIGINYTGSGADELRGCVKDAEKMCDFLTGQGFGWDNIVLLTDKDAMEQASRPTKENILKMMDWLVVGAKRDDSLFFYYAGHGRQIKDQNGDEADEWDEAIVPVDATGSGGIITDDAIYATLIQRLPVGCRLTALVDACTSGTVLDLPHVYRAANSLIKRPAGTAKEYRPWPLSRRDSMVNAPDVVFWSACKDGELARDRHTLTQAFVKIMKKHKYHSLNYEEMLKSIRELLHESKGEQKQKPQFGTYHPYHAGDMRRPFFISAREELAPPTC